MTNTSNVMDDETYAVVEGLDIDHGIGNVNYGFLHDHLHGRMLTMREDIDELYEQIDALHINQQAMANSINTYMNNFRLILGALIQRESPETIARLINGPTVPEAHESPAPPPDSQ